MTIRFRDVVLRKRREVDNRINKVKRPLHRSTGHQPAFLTNRLDHAKGDGEESDVDVKMYLRRSSLAPLVIMAFVISSQIFAAEIVEPMNFCEGPSTTDGDEINPLSQFTKSFASSGIGVHGGRSLSHLAGSITTKGFFIREAGVIAGRLLVWIFEATNPIVAAIGFVVEPTALGKCDSLYSDDPDCKKLKPCVQPVAAVPDHH